MAKRKSLGFNGGSGLVVYIGESTFGTPNPSIIQNAKDAWNHTEVAWLQKIKKSVKRISILKLSSNFKYAGRWDNEKSKLEIFDNGNSSPRYYRCVIIHEMAHAWYDKNVRLSPDDIAKFREAVKDLNPVNEYTFKNKTKWGESLYANELHSFVAEHLYAGREVEMGDAENLQRLLDAYHELHRCGV